MLGVAARRGDHRGGLRRVNALALLANVLCAAGLIALQRYRVVPAATVLELGMVFELVVAFPISTLETSLPFSDGFVRGGSNLAIWIVIVGFLVPNTPLVTLSAALLAAPTWPVAYLLCPAGRGLHVLDAPRDEGRHGRSVARPAQDAGARGRHQRSSGPNS